MTYSIWHLSYVAQPKHIARENNLTTDNSRGIQMKRTRDDLTIWRVINRKRGQTQKWQFCCRCSLFRGISHLINQNGQFCIHMLFPENMENCAKETQLVANQIKNQELAHLCFPSLDLFALLEFCYSYRIVFCLRIHNDKIYDDPKSLMANLKQTADHPTNLWNVGFTTANLELGFESIWDWILISDGQIRLFWGSCPHWWNNGSVGK